MTYNRATLRLYKEPKLYNGSRYTKYFSSESERDAYFANPDLDLGEIQYNSTDGTINVKRNLGVLLEYSYGILTVMDTDMYIFIDDIQVGYNDVSTIYYSIDYYETARFKFNVTKGHITRYNGSKPQYMEQPYTSLSPSIKVYPLDASSSDLIEKYSSGMFVWSMVKTTGELESSKLMYGLTEINQYSKVIFINGLWQEIFGYGDSDIKDCFVVPFLLPSKIDEQVTYGLFEKKSVVVKLITDVDVTIDYYESVPDKFEPYIEMDLDIGVTLKSDEQTKYYLKDWNSNLIWEAPYNYQFRYLHMVFCFGVTHFNIRGMFDTVPTNSDYNMLNENVGPGFCYECRHVTLFVDSYSEYVMRMRDYDVESRRIQNSIEFDKGLVSTAEAAGYGFAFGGPFGAIASLAGGLVETFGTSIINNTYAPQIQRLEDRKHALMQDEMSIIGDSLTPWESAIRVKDGVLFSAMNCIVEIDMDDASKERMDNDIAVNGYHCDETVSDIDSLISTGTIIQADNVVIEGTISSQYRNDIASRFERGIEFI